MLPQAHFSKCSALVSQLLNVKFTVCEFSPCLSPRFYHLKESLQISLGVSGFGWSPGLACQNKKVRANENKMLYRDTQFLRVALCYGVTRVRAHLLHVNCCFLKRVTSSHQTRLVDGIPEPNSIGCISSWCHS